MLSAREVESEPEPLEGRPQIMGDLDREPLGRVLFLQELLRLYLADLGTHLVAIRKACWVAAIEGGERGRRATDTMKRVSEDMWAKACNIRLEKNGQIQKGAVEEGVASWTQWLTEGRFCLYVVEQGDYVLKQSHLAGKWPICRGKIWRFKPPQ